MIRRLIPIHTVGKCAGFHRPAHLLKPFAERNAEVPVAQFFQARPHGIPLTASFADTPERRVHGPFPGLD